MAETPQEAPITATQKRPLEEPSSPSGPNDQPDAKRPALDKILKEDGSADPAVATDSTVGDAIQPEETNTEDITTESSLPADVKLEPSVTDKQGDTVVPDAPVNGTSAGPPTPHGLPASAGTANGVPGDRAGSQAPSSYHQQDETGWLHVRAIISSAEAATVIGKGGENVSQIRRMAGAKCTVSEYSRGAVERILTVSGLVDAVAKVS